MHSLKIGGIVWVIILFCALALRFAPVPLLSSTGSACVFLELLPSADWL